MKTTKPSAPNPSSGKTSPTTGVATATDRGSAARPVEALEPASCETAYAALRPKLLALGTGDLSPPRVDVQRAATASFGICARLREPKLRSRLEKVASIGELDLRDVDDLPVIARATFYARHKFLLATATRSYAALPADLVESCMARRERMLRWCDYMLGDTPDCASRIAAISRS